MVFSNENTKYEWSGAFGKLRFSSANRPSVVESSSNTERLAVLELKNTNQSIERTDKGYVVISDPEFGPDSKPKQIPPNEAGNGLLFQLYSKEYAFINRALQGFEKMVFRDHTLSQADIRAEFYRVRLARPYPKQFRDMTIEELKKSGFSTAERLFIASKNEFNELKLIEERFINIFPEVTEWKIVENPLFGRRDESGYIEYKIKVNNSRDWIKHQDISSGMLRILNYFAEVYFADEETVFLIDEFENSLGHNCLPIMAEDILVQSTNHQFLMTSHHPDIINVFPIETWIVVKRKNGAIENFKASDVPFFNRSKHEPYLALINHFDSP